MNIKENSRFETVEAHEIIQLGDIIHSAHTLHMDKSRKERMDTALSVNAWPDSGKQAGVHKVFLVDKRHKDGKELHCVTRRGVIFILNEQKFLNGSNCFITALIARPNQVKRLYDEVGLTAPQGILDMCYENFLKKLNK